MRKFIFFLTLLSCLSAGLTGYAQKAIFVHETPKLISGAAVIVSAHFDPMSTLLADCDSNTFFRAINSALNRPYTDGFQYGNYIRDTVVSSTPIVSKLDLDGNILWTSGFSHDSLLISQSSTVSASILDIETDNNLDVIVTGTFWGELHFNGTFIDTAESYLPQLFILKLNGNNGNVIWGKTIKCGWAKKLELVIDESNNLYISGKYQDTLVWNNQTYLGYDTVYNLLQAPSFEESAFVAKVYSDGSEGWIKNCNLISGQYALRFSDLAISDDNELFFSIGVDGQYLFENEILLPGVSGIFQLVKYDTAGNILWNYKTQNDYLAYGDQTFTTDSHLYISFHILPNYYDFELNHGNKTYSYVTGNSGEFNYPILRFDLASGQLDTSAYIKTSLFVEYPRYFTKGDKLYMTGRTGGTQGSSGFFGDLQVQNPATKAPFLAIIDEDSLKPIGIRDEYVYVNEPTGNFDYGLIVKGRSIFNSMFVNRSMYIDNFHIEQSPSSFNGQSVIGEKNVLVKYRDCSEVKASVENLAPGSLCAGDTALLTSNANDSLIHTWIRNGWELPGADSSVYATTIAGDYRVVVSDGLGCSDTSGLIGLTTQALVQANLNLTQNQFCEGDSAVLLTGGTPAGGQYNGLGVSGGFFDPAQAGLGSGQIFYKVTDINGCTDSAGVTVSVKQTPLVVFIPTGSAICEDDTLTLTTAFPSGGVFSGNGVSGNQLIGSQAGVGTHSISYTFTNSFGCGASDSISVSIKTVPNVSFDLGLDSSCIAHSPIALSGASPAGGTFSGTGVSGNFFIPGIVNQGQSYAIDYSIDSGGCSATVTDYIYVDSFPVLSLPALDSLCESGTSFQLTHGLPLGGTYTGSFISSGAFDPNAAGSGSHTIQYIYSNACTSDTAISTIEVLSTPTIAETIDSVSCNGLTDGAIEVSVNGGVGPYSFQWNIGDDSTYIDSLSSGTYTVTATGLNGCVASKAIDITEPLEIILTLDSSTNVICNEYNNGEAHVSASGGAFPYSFAWSSGNAGSSVAGLSAGQHEVIATDVNGCKDSLVVTIQEVNPVELIQTTIPVSCNNATDGVASISASGGAGVYDYLWSTGDTLVSLSGLDSGAYFVTVTDTIGCFHIDTLLISEPDSLAISFDVHAITCSELQDGSIKASISGGNGSDTFAWNSGSSVDSIHSLTAGWYSLTVTDSKGCEATDSALVSEPDSISIQLSILDSLLCFGDSNGTITASTAGGTGQYTTMWNTGLNSDSLVNASVGTYTIQVSDENNCQASKSVQLIEPIPLALSIDSVTDAKCFGASDGAASVLATGGTGSLVFNWNNGSVGNQISGLDSGQYAVTVTDQNGCASSTIVSIDHPAPLLLSLQSNPVLCFGESNGTVNSAVLNAQGPLNYAWSNGTNQSNLSGIPAGSYALTVTDSTGCEASNAIQVDEPDSLGLSFSIADNLCFGDSSGQATLSISGGVMPYTQLWSNGSSELLNDSLTSGNYSVTVTDSNGCEKIESITVNQPNPVSITVDSTSDLLCYQDASGAIYLTGLGGVGNLSFLWNDNNQNASRTGLSAGNYSVTLSDTNLCATDTAFTINEPLELVISLDSIIDNPCFGDSLGALYASSTGGTGNVSYSWSNGFTQSAIQGQTAGVYSVTITDQNGCTDSLQSEILQPTVLSFIDSTVNASCDNTADGSIALFTSGGVGGYVFNWSTAGSGALLAGLEPGIYSFSITDINNCLLEDSLMVGFDFQSPVIDLGQDTALCEGDSMVLNAQNQGSSYQWSNGETNQEVVIQNAGMVTVLVTDTNSCQNSDTIQIDFNPIPAFDLGNDTALCKDTIEAGILLTGPQNMTSYNWSNGGVNPSEIVSSFGTYTLIIEDSNGCFAVDSVSITVDTCLGIADLAIDLGVKVYPNPSDGLFYIQFTDPISKEFDLEVLNGQAQQVQRFESLNSQSLEINLREFGAGFYWIRIKPQSESYWHSFQVVVQ